MERSTPTDERLISDYVRGSRAGFELVIRRHTTDLFRFLYRMTQDSSTAEELVQDVFFQVSVSAAQFNTKRSFKPWLYTIAANKARDWHRRRKRRREVPLHGDSVLQLEDHEYRFTEVLTQEVDHPSTAIHIRESRRVVRNIVEQLRPQWREILVLSYYHRLTYREIAEVLAIPLGTVKSRLHAAVASFAQEYRDAIGSAFRDHHTHDTSDDLEDDIRNRINKICDDGSVNTNKMIRHEP